MAPERAKALKVVVADERPGMGLASALAEVRRVRVAAEVGTAAEAMEAVESSLPSTLILDVSLPRLGGLSLIRAVAKLHPGVTIIAVAPDASRARAAAILKAGAKAFLLRDGFSLAVDGCLAALAAGRPYVDHRLNGVVRPCARRRLAPPSP